MATTEHERELLTVAKAVQREEPILDQEGADIVVYTLAWKGDHPAYDEKPTALVHSRIFVNGVEWEHATGLTVEARGGDFVQARIDVVPASVRFVPVDPEAWKLADPSLATETATERNTTDA